MREDEGGQVAYENSSPSSQFCCKPKTALRNFFKVFNKKCI